MKDSILFLICIFFLVPSSAFAEVFDSSLSLSHDAEKTANLTLEISGDLLARLNKGERSLGFKLLSPDGSSFYPEDVYYRIVFSVHNTNKNSFYASVNLFDKAKLDSNGVVKFFTELKGMTMAFYEYKSGSPKHSGDLKLKDLCEGGKVLNLSGADKCNILPREVTNLPIDSRVCEDDLELNELAANVCGADVIKETVEKRFGCKFKCESKTND